MNLKNQGFADHNNAIFKIRGTDQHREEESCFTKSPEWGNPFVVSWLTNQCSPNQLKVETSCSLFA